MAEVARRVDRAFQRSGPVPAIREDSCGGRGLRSIRLAGDRARAVATQIAALPPRKRSLSCRNASISVMKISHCPVYPRKDSIGYFYWIMGIALLYAEN